MTARTVDMRDAVQHFAELVAEVETGVEIILTDGPTLRARLIPVAPPTPTRPLVRIAGLHEGAMIMSDDFDDPLPDEFWFGESSDETAP